MCVRVRLYVYVCECVYVCLCVRASEGVFDILFYFHRSGICSNSISILCERVRTSIFNDLKS